MSLAQRLRREPQQGDGNENHLSKAGQGSRQIDEGTESETVLPSVAAAGGSLCKKLCFHCKALVLLAHTWRERTGPPSSQVWCGGFKVGHPPVSQLKVWGKAVSSSTRAWLTHERFGLQFSAFFILSHIKFITWVEM